MTASGVQFVKEDHITTPDGLSHDFSVHFYHNLETTMYTTNTTNKFP
jgi:hypothetical protein